MLPTPNLDDRTFDQLVEEAKRLIPLYAPEWTDYNLHDPGITFIELFAWLTEMEHYYLDRVRDENYQKFLKLLGIKQRVSYPASTDVTFSKIGGSEGTVSVPAGTRIKSGDIVFETLEGLEVLAADIKKVITCTRTGYIDNTEHNSYLGVTYYAFGEKPEVSCVLYIGFETAEDSKPFPKNKEVSLSFNLFEDYPVTAGKKSDDFIPSVTLEWQYYGADKDWHKVKQIRDETKSLYQSGRLIFEIPGEIEKNKLDFYDGEIFWLRCVLKRGQYELAPRIKNIMINTVPAVQGETLCKTLSYNSSGKEGQSFKLSTYLSKAGTNTVQVREPEGYWKYWNQAENLSSSYPSDSSFVINNGKKPMIYFGNGTRGKMPPKGKENIRVISYMMPLKEMRSNALPNQMMKLGVRPVIPESFMLQVEEKGTDGNFYWVDWDMKNDFAASCPEDRHYVLNAGTGEVFFGDGINGLIPPAPQNKGCNIRVIACRIGGGEAGNIKGNALRITDPLDECKNLSASNLQPAYGGTEEEDLLKAQARARKDMKTLHSAVTAEDYEKLALAAPGVRVARAKAVPLLAPGCMASSYALRNDQPGVISVVAVPYSDCERPVPSKEFLMNIKRHLDKHRLITTEVHVIPPQYIEVSVNAVVVFKPEFIPDSSRVESKLKSFLSPLPGNNDGGWPFGRAVYKSEIYEAIEKLEGVDYVEEVSLFASGQDFNMDDRGNIHIGPASLVISGEHSIEALGSMRGAYRE